MKMKRMADGVCIRVRKVRPGEPISLREHALKFIAEREESFCVRDFTAWLCERQDWRQDNYKLQAASLHAMKRMALRGELVVVKEGGMGHGKRWIFQGPGAGDQGPGGEVKGSIHGD